MITVIKKTDPNKPEAELIRQAANIISDGGLVAFPTETVYGLGANAKNEAAVAKIYKVKGRPSDNPLIWHGNALEDFWDIARFSETALKLAEAFWPGPFTMVLPTKNNKDKSVAVRVSSNPVIRHLIAESGCIIAAPSANISGRPSPTKADHVKDDLDGLIDMIIDGGQCKNGLESTVTDLFTGDCPAILRPGAVTAEMIISVAKELRPPGFSGKTISPGMKYRHYAPKTPIILVTGTNFDEIVDDHKKKGERVGVLRLNKNSYEEAAFSLYERLRDFDKSDVSLIIAEAVPEEGVGAAVMNRLRKAAAKVV